MQIIKNQFGLTLIELIVCTIIIGILAGTALPLSRNFVQNEKERLLKERLRELRLGIDRYYDRMKEKLHGVPEEALYPLKLENLVDNKILRRIPVDPMTGRAEWGTRSTTDTPDSIETDALNVFDVHSLSTGTAFDGTRYCDW